MTNCSADECGTSHPPRMFVNLDSLSDEMIQQWAATGQSIIFYREYAPVFVQPEIPLWS